MEPGQYLIVGQRHTSRYDEATQRPLQGLEVTFTYGNPVTTGQVFVTGEVPDVSAVQNAIRDYVQRGEQVQQLTD